MSLFRHFRAIARKEFFHILRDPGTLLLVTIGPVFLMMILTYTMTSDVKHVPVAIIDEAQNEASTELIQRFEESSVIDIAQYLEADTELESLFERREVVAVIHIPANYGRIALTGTPQVATTIDGMEPISAEAVLEEVFTISYEYTQELAEEQFAGLPILEMLQEPIQAEIETLYNPDLRLVANFYPGLAAIILSLPAISLAMSLAKEAEAGTMEQLVATPVNKHALLLGKMAPYFLFGILDIYVLALLGHVVFDVPLAGSIVDYSIIALLFMASNLGIGLLIAVLIRSQQVAMIAAFLIFFIPPFFLSGLFFPIEAMPFELQLELQWFPATQYVAASKAIYLQATPITDLWFPVVMMAVSGIIFFEGSTFLFRKKVGLSLPFLNKLLARFRRNPEGSAADVA